MVKLAQTEKYILNIFIMQYHKLIITILVIMVIAKISIQEKGKNFIHHVMYSSNSSSCICEMQEAVVVK